MFLQKSLRCTLLKKLCFFIVLAKGCQCFVGSSLIEGTVTIFFFNSVLENGELAQCLEMLTVRYKNSLVFTNRHLMPLIAPSHFNWHKQWFIHHLESLFTHRHSLVPCLKKLTLVVTMCDISYRQMSNIGHNVQQMSAIMRDLTCNRWITWTLDGLLWLVPADGNRALLVRCAGCEGGGETGVDVGDGWYCWSTSRRLLFPTSLRLSNSSWTVPPDTCGKKKQKKREDSGDCLYRS